jgi:hypothetical protein
MERVSESHDDGYGRLGAPEETLDTITGRHPQGRGERIRPEIVIQDLEGGQQVPLDAGAIFDRTRSDEVADQSEEVSHILGSFPNGPLNRQKLT